MKVAEIDFSRLGEPGPPFMVETVGITKVDTDQGVENKSWLTFARRLKEETACDRSILWPLTVDWLDYVS